MKKYLLFLLVLVVGSVKGQIDLSCNILPPQFICDNQVFIDTLSFVNDTNNFMIDTSAGNIWHLGHSHKPLFDSVSSNTGFITDSVFSYGVNAKSSFVVKHPNSLFFLGSNFLFFEHKYETDSLLDGGYIEYSCDHGQNWRIINGSDIQSGDPPQGIFYDNYLGLPDSYWQQSMPTLNDTIPAFTGTNNDWQWTGVQLAWFLPVMKPDENRWQECWETMDTLYYRFTFQSDNIDNDKAGWMIRNIVIGTADMPSSLNEFSSLPLKLFPNPATEKISIELPPNSGALSGVVISDIAGNVALRTTEAKEIDVSTLSPGIYFVLAETDKLVFRQKFLKQ